MATIRENLKRLRKGRGWSQETLGKRAGYATGGMIDRIEKGVTEPSYKQLLALAQVLEVTVSDLTGDTVPCGVTNNANGDHQVVYQHVERLALMTDELQVILRQVVREEVDARCTRLVEEMWTLVAEAMRAGGATGAAPPLPMGQGEG